MGIIGLLVIRLCTVMWSVSDEKMPQDEYMSELLVRGLRDPDLESSRRAPEIGDTALWHLNGFGRFQETGEPSALPSLSRLFR